MTKTSPIIILTVMASLKTKKPTIAVKAVPTPDHVAYAADKSRLFNEKLKNIKEAPIPAMTPRAGHRCVKPSDSFSIVLPNTSDTMANASQSNPFISMPLLSTNSSK